MSMEISTVVRHTKFAAEETRKQILDVAEFCFCETGFSKTTLEMIAARAGCTRGAIYWYFNEKKIFCDKSSSGYHYHYLMSLQPSKMGEFLNRLKRCIVAYHVA
ncbi:TetR family transcriptional regulator [Escherichia coli]|uniref:TetR family transcriptional regulator n=1 Tax=Escherichia coli TaxID=562 RepID=UPI003299D376